MKRREQRDLWIKSEKDLRAVARGVVREGLLAMSSLADEQLGRAEERGGRGRAEDADVEEATSWSVER